MKETWKEVIQGFQVEGYNSGSRLVILTVLHFESLNTQLLVSRIAQLSDTDPISRCSPALRYCKAKRCRLLAVEVAKLVIDNMFSYYMSNGITSS